MKISKKRNNTIDILKGLGILFVMLGHLTYSGQYQWTIINAFSMPLFFLVSGYLYKEKNIKMCIKRCFKSYMIPAYIFLLLDFVKEILIRKSIFIFSDYKSFFYTITFVGGIYSNYPLWFLPAIFFTIFIHTLLSKKSRIIFSIFCIIFSTFFKINTDLYLWPLALINMFPLFTFAHLYKNSKMENYVNRLLETKITFIIEVLLFIVVCYINGETSLIQQNLGKSYILFLISGILGKHILLIVSRLINKLKYKNLITLIGKNTIIILLTHYYICRAFIPRIFKMIGFEYLLRNIFVQIVIVFVLWNIYYLMIKVLEKNNKLNFILK